MQKVTRRQFAKQVIGAVSLASSTMFLGCFPKKMEDKPLAIDLFGPMAVTPTGNAVEVRMPILDADVMNHQAGIQTSVGSKLLQGKYCLTGPSSRRSIPAQHGPIFNPRTSIDYSQSTYLFISLPKPRLIIALDPVYCKIYPAGSQPPTTFLPYAVGLRLLYDRTGYLALGEVGADGKCVTYSLPTDSDPDDSEVNISILYAPVNTSDICHPDAKKSFCKLSMLYGQKLEVCFQEDDKCYDGCNGLSKPQDATSQSTMTSGPIQDCKSPICVGG